MNGAVGTLASGSTQLYVGGGFTSLGGQARYRLGGLDPSTGGGTQWNPNLEEYGSVGALAVSGGTVYIGGSFWAIQGSAHSNFAAVTEQVVGVGDVSLGLAAGLLQAAPNPFRGEVTLRFALPGAGDVRLEIYDVHGRRLRVIERGTLPAGEQRVIWNGRDDSGHPASAGLYFARVHAPGLHLGTRLLRLK